MTSSSDVSESSQSANLCYGVDFAFLFELYRCSEKREYFERLSEVLLKGKIRNFCWDIALVFFFIVVKVFLRLYNLLLEERLDLVRIGRI